MECDIYDFGDRTFTVNGGNGANATGGSLLFGNTTYGATGTLIAEGGRQQGGGGVITVIGQGHGVPPRVEVFLKGSVDFSDWFLCMHAAGSMEGIGIIFFGQYNVFVGSNNLIMSFSCVFLDGVSCFRLCLLFSRLW